MVKIGDLKKANGKMAFRSGMGMETFDLASQFKRRGVPVRFPGMDDPTQR